MAANPLSRSLEDDAHALVGVEPLADVVGGPTTMARVALRVSLHGLSQSGGSNAAVNDEGR